MTDDLDFATTKPGAIEWLRAYLPHGAKVGTVQRSVSRTGKRGVFEFYAIVSLEPGAPPITRRITEAVVELMPEIGKMVSEGVSIAAPDPNHIAEIVRQLSVAVHGAEAPPLDHVVL